MLTRQLARWAPSQETQIQFLSVVPSSSQRAGFFVHSQFRRANASLKDLFVCKTKLENKIWKTKLFAWSLKELYLRKQIIVFVKLTFNSEHWIFKDFFSFWNWNSESNRISSSRYTRRCLVWIVIAEMMSWSSVFAASHVHMELFRNSNSWIIPCADTLVSV